MTLALYIRIGSRKLRKAGSCFAVSINFLLMPGSPSAQEAQNVCPKGYSLLQSICLSSASGDVVNPSPASVHLAPTGTELSQACVACDLAAWTLIERHGEAGSLSSQAATDAFFDSFVPLGIQQSADAMTLETAMQG